ncbi:MAG: hypothetical protein IMZ64_12330 [Bacteroidetes bacterium]|nr:hypothetical protein [Bacteroidota bacterium]
MKKSLLVLSITLLGTLLGSNVMGQDNGSASNTLSLGMPELSLLSSPSGIVNLQLTTAVAGEAVKSSIRDSTTRVKISSVISGSTTRKMSASVTLVPNGTYLKLMAQIPSTNFGGTVGTYGTDVTLSSTATTIISGIGSCYSGTGALDGYVLRYIWGLDNPAANYGLVRAVAGNTTVTVTLTLAAEI